MNITQMHADDLPEAIELYGLTFSRTGPTPMTDTNTAAALSAEADGWIEWHGSENPVPGQMVNIRHRGLQDMDDAEWLSDAQHWGYGAGLYAHDIIAYRVATPAPAALEGSSLGEGDAAEWAQNAWLAVCEIEDPKLAAATIEAYAQAALQPSSAADAKPVACSDEALEIANANHEKFERLWYLAKDDVDRLKLAICGGEDVPGAIDAVSVEDCEGFIAEERSRHIDTEARLEYVRRSRDGAADRADRLYRALVGVRDSIETYPLDDSQTCMCGSPVEGHNVGSGHAPVSQADHAISLIVEAIDKALGIAVIPDDAPIGAGRSDDYEGPDVGMHDTEIVERHND